MNDIKAPQEPTWIDPTAAAAELIRVEKAQALANQAVRLASGWTVRYLVAFGITSAVFLSLCDVGGVVAWFASLLAYAVIYRWFAQRERVSWRGFDRLSVISFAAWSVLQLAGCAVGFAFFSHVVTYWVSLGLAVSAPMFIGAWRAAHR
jgi:hypothetical protein